MERESFEDPAIAGLMNERFVSVKVDREERPDVDSIYMQAVQALTGHGGWPMTVFLTPDGVPFYGGTYFPPGDRHGMPGFPRVLEAVAEYYRDRRGEAAEVGQGASRAAPSGRARPGRRGSPHARRCSTPPTRGFVPSSTLVTEGSGGRPSSPSRWRSTSSSDTGVGETTPGALEMLRPDADADGPGRHLRSAGRRASTATRSTRSGWCPTSRRCSTTRPSWRSSTSRPGRRRAIPSTVA